MLNFWEEENISFEEEGVEAPTEIEDKLIVDNAKIKREIFWTDGPDNSENLKWLFCFKEKPANNIYTLKLGEDWDNFYWFYQPIELSQAEKDQDGFRPDNVRGSYAVYHKSKRNNKYKTGKALHIYRPQATDADGKKVWTTLHIEKGIYTVTIPQDFLDKAVYPVVVNDIIGYNTIGGSEGAFGSGNIEAVGPDEAATTAGLDKCYVYSNMTTGTGVVTMGVYDYDSGGDIPNNLIGNTAEVTITTGGFAWYSSNCTGSITSGTSYYAALHAGSNASAPRAKYDITGPLTTETQNDTYSAGNMPDPFTANPSEQTWFRSLYAETSAGAGTNTQINIGDDWKEIAGAQINIGDAWKAAAGMQINIGDAWKTIF